jgi:class 3 adenylate cyclase/tetratricopeptide (TPR) repeat protein
MAACPACGSEYEGNFKFCPECAAPLPAAAHRETRKTVTALFCDLVGSTALGEQLDPEVLRPVLGGYFAEMRSAVEHHGGRIEKFIGDAVVAVFGLPSAHEDDALRAVRAGVEMQERLETLNASSSIPLAARVGITTGEVLVSGDGNPIGDAMNTAARLQTAASPGSVLIGDPTWRLVRDAIMAEAVEPLDARGKAEPVPAWRVMQVEAGPRRQSTTPFVGRGRLIASLGVVFDEAVADGAPVLATVLGDPGIGKSRLLDAFLRELSGTTILRTSVPAAGEGPSLAAVADLVRAAAGADTPDGVADKLALLVRNSPDAGALEAALRSLLGLGGQSPADSTWAIRRLLETLTTGGPVIVVLDDLHWASPALIDLIEDAARWTRGPVLLLCAARLDLLDARRSWGGGMQRAITITVGPLEAGESRTLADALVGANLLDTDRLVATAEGNPLFLEQLAVEARELGDAWDPSAAPTTIRALLEARLDRCSPDVTSALELASVQGSRFRMDLLEALAPEDLDLGDVLRQAERAHLAREVEPNVGVFAHALVRETAYHRLPKASRADLHAALADLFPADEEELAAIHLEQAAALRAELGHPDIEVERRAGELLARTGARAFSRLDFVTASDLLERAAALLPRSSPVRLEMLPDFAIALMEAGRADDAAVLLEETLQQAERIGSRRDAIRIRLQQLALYAFTGPSEDEIRLGISEGRALLAELTDLDDDVGLAQGWTVIEYLHVYIGEMAHHAEAQARSFVHAERAGRLREQIQAGGDQPCAAIRGPCTAGAMKKQAESMRQNPNRIISTGGIALAAAAAALVGDMPAYRSAESEWRLAIEAGGFEWSGADQALAGLALVLLLTDAPEAAEAMARQGLDVMERLGDVWVVSEWSWLLPLALAKQGRLDEASVLADAFAERYTRIGAAEGRIYRGVALSIARRSRGRPEEALTLANEAASIARSTDSNLLRALALEHLADLQYETDPSAAIGTLNEVAGVHEASGNTVGAERVARVLAPLS